MVRLEMTDPQKIMHKVERNHVPTLCYFISGVVVPNLPIVSGSNIWIFRDFKNPKMLLRGLAPKLVLTKFSRKQNVSRILYLWFFVFLDIRPFQYRDPWIWLPGLPNFASKNACFSWHASWKNPQKIVSFIFSKRTPRCRHFALLNVRSAGS